MTTSRGLRAFAAAALVLVAVGACSDAGEDPTASPTASPSSHSPSGTASTDTATTTPSTDSERASAAAEAVLRKYYDVRNQIRQDPSQPLSLLDDVAISTELAAQKNLMAEERKKGVHQTGETHVAELKVTSVNLDNTDPKAGTVPTVQIDLCFDVSRVDLVDKKGKSVVSDDRPDTGWIQFLVSNYEWDKNPDGGWRVASSQDIERAACSAS